MKKIIIFLGFIFFASIGFSQEASKIVLIDSVKGHVYEIKKGKEVTIKTDSIIYKGSLNEINKDEIVLENYHIKWSDVKYFKFRDEERLHVLMKITGIALLTNVVLTIIALIPDSDGFGGMVFLLLTLPVLAITAIFALIGYLIYLNGRKIKYKAKK